MEASVKIHVNQIIFMKLFFHYLSDNKRSIFSALLFNVIFLVVFYLSSLPLKALGYAFFLCFFMAVVIGVPDFLSYKKKHDYLAQLKEEITVSLNNMIQASSLLEEDYQSLVELLHQDKINIVNKMKKNHADLIDYYTIWVHQIKTPIAAMSLILQSSQGEQSQELFEELQKIEQYVEMVLGYLRLESSSSDYVIREYDLDPIIKQVVRKYASQFIRKKIKFNYEPLGFSVLTDEKWLLFIVEQVISNALKYTKSGSITISSQEGKTLCIKDTGIGIAKGDLPRIFEKGFTGYNGRADKKSTGIGLYLCKKIAVKLGHDISAQSVLGKGTIIKIKLDSLSIEME